MAIVPLRRLTLIGELKRRDEVIAELQRLGCVHLEDFSGGGKDSKGPTAKSTEGESKSEGEPLTGKSIGRGFAGGSSVTGDRGAPATGKARVGTGRNDLPADLPGDDRPKRGESDDGASATVASAVGVPPVTRLELKEAIAYLSRCSEHRPPISDAAATEPIATITAEVLSLESESRALGEEAESIREKIAQTRPWGDFHLPEESALAGRRLFFYKLTHRQVRGLPAATLAGRLAERIRRDRQHEYWVVIAKAPPVGMPVEPEDLDDRSLSELERRATSITRRLEEIQIRRMAMTSWLDRLRAASVAAEDETSRLIARGRAMVDGPVFALQGWVPAGRVADLESFALRSTLAVWVRPPGVDDEPPTLLSNPRPIAGAEGAVTFFMTPGYRSWDPTWVMYFSFAAFFAMILADAGYGIVLGVILAALTKRLGRSDTGRRFRQLAWFMVFVTVVYGVLIGSYFGFSPPAGGLFDRLVIKSRGTSIMQDREAMMLISATIGVFHLMLANLIVAWRWLGSGKAFASVGWVSAILGGWLIAVGMIPQPDVAGLLAGQFGGDVAAWSGALTTIGWWLLGGGLTAVFLFSSDRPLRGGIKSVLMRGVDGLMGLTNVTKAFGDALSYLRLFALGLASAQLAIVFNGLAADASQVRGIGLLLGLLIFLIGHTLNLILAVVGGVVHGLRLNCIEFFGWSLNEEGRPFEAFQMKANK